MSRRVLITGATGFIGRVLLSYLLKDDEISSILCVDNLSNSEYTPGEPLFSDKRVSVLIKNVSDMTDNDTEDQLDDIYHLASPVGPVGVLKYAGNMGPMIIEDSYKMALLAEKHNARLIDISTSEVYGCDPNGIPQTEDLTKVVPAEITVRLEYGVAKLACEVFLANRTKVFGLNCCIVRPYNIVSYGQQAAAGFVLPRFFEQALANKPLTVYQPGTQRRTFTDVRDFVESLILVMAKGKSGEIYNIGNPNNLHTILDLANRVIEKTGSTSGYTIVDPQKEHGKLFTEAWEKIPNINKINQELGWNPTRSLDDIIDEAIRRYNEL